MTFITPNSWSLIKAYGRYEKGFLPNGIAWNKESQKFNEAMDILDNEFTRQRNRIAEGNNARNRFEHNSKGNR